jgi:hypothetical protein
MMATSTSLGEQVDTLLAKIARAASQARTPEAQADIGWLAWKLTEGSKQVVDDLKSRLRRRHHLLLDTWVARGREGVLVMEVASAQLRLGRHPDIKSLQSLLGEHFHEVFEVETTIRPRKDGLECLAGLPEIVRNQVLAQLEQFEPAPTVTFRKA